jgi:peptidoglycan hydrolase-like protein with peptidoglycan-binding domain
MNKRLKATSCALAVLFALSINTVSPKVGPFGIDAVSAATGAAPAPAKPATPSKSTSSNNSNSSSNSGSYSSSMSSTGLLKLNSQGNNVKLLQTSLNNKGYKLTVDGIFGDKTLTAVKNYQSKNGLTADGFVGPSTFAKLNPAPIEARLLRVGSTGSDVKLLQTNLNSKGYKLTADGVFGELTLAAVKNYQSKNKLSVDGLVGPATLAKVNVKPTAPKPATPKPPVVKPPVVVVPPVDTVTAASLVSDADTFAKSIGKDGKWIVTTTKDLTTTKNLVVEGEFRNTKIDAVTGLGAIQRKIGLYTQEKVDGKNVVTARFTLTAPKITILSPSASLERGTFKGDIYVSAPKFKLVDMKVEGNIYFTTQEAKDTFIPLDATTTVSGVKELVEVDAVTTASVVKDAAAFENAISTNGQWIAAITKDLTINKEIVVDGDFKNKRTPPVTTRKIALYSQDAAKVTTRKFTLTAPKLTIKSPSASIQKGIFVGDIYVSALNFKLVDTKVVGNVYFTTAEAESTFSIDATSSISGAKELKTN